MNWARIGLTSAIGAGVAFLATMSLALEQGVECMNSTLTANPCFSAPFLLGMAKWSVAVLVAGLVVAFVAWFDSRREARLRELNVPSRVEIAKVAPLRSGLAVPLVAAIVFVGSVLSYQQIDCESPADPCWYAMPTAMALAMWAVWSVIAGVTVALVAWLANGGRRQPSQTG